MEMTDKEIVEGCLNNRAEAQKALFDKYSTRMMGLCLRYTGDQEEAQDVLQEGFIKVFQKLNQFSGTGALGGWISTIMVNTALIHLRKKKREGHSTPADEEYSLSSKEVGVLSALSAQELMDLVQAMPEGYRTVFNMFAIDGFGHKEIAAHLNISENTSKTQYHKARAYLRRELQKLDISIQQIGE